MRAFYAMLLCVTLWPDAFSKAFVPVVYRDDYVTINAGIVDASQRLQRVGEVLTLSIAVHFDPVTTQINELDDAFFERMFARHPEVRLLESAGPPEVTRSGSIAVIENQWQFQILGCPDASISCPGAREYALPLAILDYAVTGEPGGRPSQRSARLRPWPDDLSLVSAFPKNMPEDARLENWIAGGAMPEPLASEKKTSLPLVVLATGALLLLIGFFRATDKDSPKTLSLAVATTRWQQVAMSLGDDELADAEWLDRCRRCLVWYLVDVEGINPYADAINDTRDERLQLLADINERSVVDDRPALRERLDALIGIRRDTTQQS